MSSITKRPGETRYQARYRDPGGKQITKRFDRKVDAQAWLDEATAAIVTGTHVAPAAGKTTLTSFYKEWAERQNWASGTELAMSLAVRRCTFAEVPFGRLRRSHVEAWIKSMVSDGLAPGTVKTRVTNVRSVLRGAVHDQRLGRDPSAGVTLPRLRRREMAMRLPTEVELRSLMVAADESFVAFIALGAFAGMRLGEIAGLKVSDVNFLRRRIEVRRQVQRAPGGAVEIRAPKYGSERDVYIDDPLLELLADHVAQHAPGDDPGRWLFPGRGGNPWHQNTVGAAWRATCRRAGVEGITLHDTRHFYASGLIASGCDVVTVQRALGHAKATVTLSTYAHLWPTAEDRTRAAAGALMRSVLGPPEDAVRTNGGGNALTSSDTQS